MTIKAKILALVAAFAVMASAITALGLMTMADYNRVIADYTRASDNAFRGQRLNLLLSESVIEVRNIYIAKSPEQLDRRIMAMQVHLNEVDVLLKDWKADLRPGEVPQFASIEKDARTIIWFGGKVAEVARTQSPEVAEKLGTADKSLAWREAFQGRLDTMVSGIQANMLKKQAALAVYQTQRTQEFFIMAGSGVVLLLLASLWIAIRSIANPLKAITQSVVGLSQDAFDTVIPPAKGEDEISKLWIALGILKSHAIEVKRINDAKLELHLD